MELQKISDLFWKVSPNLFFFSTILGVVTGLCYAAVIPFIMYVVASGLIDFDTLHSTGESIFNSPTADIAQFFIIACALIVILKYFSSLLSIHITHKASLKHRMFLFRRIQGMSYYELEKMGQSKLLNLLRIDVPTVTGAASSYPVIWVNSVTVFGILSYLVFLNEKVFVYVLVATVLSILLYRIPLYFGTQYLKKARDMSDNVQEGIRGLIFGAKELKLNRKRSDEFLEGLLYKAEVGTRKATFKGNGFMMLADSVGELITYMVMAMVIFHLPYVFVLTQLELVGIVVALVYLSGPIGNIMGAVGAIKAGGVSLTKIQEFYTKTKSSDIEKTESIVKDWSEYRVQGLGYKYSQDDSDFALKPTTLTFKRNQITYIVGGNGSGKSTLSKCLTLHYTPTSGDVLFDDDPLKESQLESARQQISAIYSDYHLFDRLLGIQSPEIQEQIDEYFRYLELDGKVKIVDGKFSTTSLSDGQKKRLALLVLLLEDRDICLFDEWAADQDPRFKEIFYKKILPNLKAKNKVIIVITHDDRFFELADQIVVMEDGKLKEVINNSPEQV
ncbi:MAG: cyclic peptide export ABC transporter [Alteromonadaceae bacterium]|nr:cyclic peptide export ABC transporter [Alteromonadaceae bacterium]